MDENFQGLLRAFSRITPLSVTSFKIFKEMSLPFQNDKDARSRPGKQADPFSDDGPQKKP
jgi:hypothetical protein